MNGPRVVLDDPKLAAWIKRTFNIQTRAEALERLTDIDPLNETVTVDGQEHRIPADCYVDLLAEGREA
ncbi:MAG: hypothetical protein IT318_23920 [Anaerolineales bacterium]|nr:hypothetical protein [Anaerolineales bacterium]